MLSVPIIRCFVVYVLMAYFFAIGKSDQFGSQINLKNQHTEEVDLFDMFHYSNNQAPKIPNDTLDRESTNKTETIHKSKPDHDHKKSCPSSGKYRTVVANYRSIARSWTNKSKDAEKYRLTIEFSPEEFDRMKRFASSTDYDQDEVLHDVHDISHYLAVNAYVSREDVSLYTGLTWSSWVRLHGSNLIKQDIFIVLVVATVINILVFRFRVYSIRTLVPLFVSGFLTSVFMNWLALCQVEKAKIDSTLLKGLPEKCQSHSSGFIDGVISVYNDYFKLPDDVCLKYHEARNANPYLKATFEQALSMTTTKMFVTPLGMIGEGVSMFFAGIMRYLPNLSLPFIIPIVVFLIVVILFFYFKPTISLFYGMITIGPNNNQEQICNQLKDKITQLEDANRQLSLQLQQIPQIEHNSSSSSSSKNRTLTCIKRKKKNQGRFLLNQKSTVSSDDADAEI